MNSGKVIGLLAGLALVFLLVGTISAITDYKDYDSEAMTFEYQDSLNMEGQTLIEVDFSSDYIDVYKSTSGALEIFYKRRCSSMDELEALEDSFNVDISTSKIKIYLDDLTTNWLSNNFISEIITGNFSHNTYLELGIPEEYQEDIIIRLSSGDIVVSDIEVGKLDIASSSGRITLEDLLLDELESQSSSGNIEVNYIEVKDGCRISASSGRLTLTNLEAGELYLESSSGNIIGEHIISERISASASSGRIELSGKMGSANISTTSGNIKLEFDEVTDSISASASSGNVSLTIPRDTEFEIEAHFSSGNFYTDFDLDEYNNDDHYYGGSSRHGDDGIGIELNTSSGNQNLYQGP